ncbi:DUF885 family protein [Colwelliaceae bacterium BS250]
MHTFYKCKPTLIVTTLCLLLGCSEQEQTITVIESKEENKFELDIRGINDDTNAVSIYDTINQANNEFFKFRPQLAAQIAAKESDVGSYYFDKLDNYDIDSDLVFRNFMAAKAETLLIHEPSEEMADEDNRVLLANLYNYYSGMKDFNLGFIDSYFGHQPFIISQINGPLIDSVAVLTNNHAITNEQDAKNYNLRLTAFSRQIAQVNAKFIHDAEKNWLPPKAIFTSALGYINGYTAISVQNNSLLSNLKDKLELTSLSTAQKSALVSNAQSILTTDVYPAFTDVAKTLTTYLPKAAKGDGIWAQPNGDKYYQYTIKTQGDSNLSADEIHQLGVDEVERITTDMNSILKQLGYKQGSVAERMQALSKELRFSYEDNEQGKQQLIKDLNQQIVDINNVIGEQFQSQAKYQVTVKAFPKEVEDTSAGGQYSPPSMDGSKPGVFWINLRDMPGITKLDMPTLTFHETNPGHHWQISLNMSQQGLPLLRKLAAYNAYIEGWALYAEFVAFEMGMYKTDPFGNLGRLRAELFRSVRLVVDTGLHHKKWTREQAIDYMMKITGSPYIDSKAEIERYMVWPGQALGYKLGMIKILALRKHAKKLLGEKFDIKEFHDVVLLSGAMPMTMLEQKVHNWIASK